MEEFNKRVQDRYFTFIDITIENYAGNNRVLIRDTETDFEACFGYDEIDDLIKTLQEAKEVLARGRNTDE